MTIVVKEAYSGDDAAAVDRTWQQFWDGLDFLLWHLDRPGKEFLFPRNISTASTQDAQKTVDDLDRMKLYFQGALRQNCKVAAYPNYDRIAEKGLITPAYKPKVSLLFVDLDLRTFGEGKDNKDKLTTALAQTLTNIYDNLNGAIPTVLQTGGGYHVYLPLDTDYIPVFEELPEFACFGPDASVKFMRYAEKKLSNGLSDGGHRTSFKSCMLRIPNSINTKYEGPQAKVRIVQRWDGKRARSSDKFMHQDFIAYLLQEAVDKEIARLKRERRKKAFGNTASTISTTSTTNDKPWIERLLQTPVTDGRKTARDLIIIPYLIVNKGLTDREQIYDLVMAWADRCHELQRLKPSRSEFSARTISRIDSVLAADTKIKPMTLERTKQECPELYRQLVVL